MRAGCRRRMILEISEAAMIDSATQTPVPAMGWFSACKVPHGNEFGLWQTDTSAPAPAQ